MRRNGDGDRACSPRPAPRAAIDLAGRLDQRGLRRAPDRRAAATGPSDRAAPGQPVRRLQAGGRAAGGRPPTAAGRGGSLGIVRTAWLFGPPGSDFPSRILAAAERARAAGEPLRVVGDEWGTPTYTARPRRGDRRAARRGRASAGIHHLVNGGVARRADWARDVARAGPASTSTIVEVPLADLAAPVAGRRAGRVLAPTPLPSGEPLRPWPAAMADYAPTLLRAWRGHAHEPSTDRGVRAAGRPLRRRRPPRRRAGLLPRAVAGRATFGGRSAPADAGSAAGLGRHVRPGQPVDLGRRASCAASTSTAASSTTGSWPAAAPSSPSWTFGRCSTRRGERARSSRRASWARTTGSSSRPGSPTASSPSSRSSSLYLVTNEYDGTRRAGLRLGRSDRRRALAGTPASRATPDGRADPVRPAIAIQSAASAAETRACVRLRRAT